MSDALSPCDVVIVGLGATGGVAAHLLTRDGVNVVAIEAGPRHTIADWTQDELHNSHNWLAEPKARYDAPTWRETASDSAGPSPWPVVMMNAVGGATVHYEGLSPRFSPWNFRAASRTVERYGASAIPYLSTIADWPFGYDDLESFYGDAEQMIGVSGLGADDLSVDGLRGDAFEGHRTSRYPMPPLRRHGWSDISSAAARRLGWHPFPAPAALNSVPFDGRPACKYCGFCVSNGCYAGAKNSTDMSVIPRAEQSGRLRIESSTRVLRIEVDEEGPASGVTFVRDNREYFQPARVVLVGTFIYENVRLLLCSISSAFPNGLSNNAGQVGRHYIAHVVPHVYGLFPGVDLNLFNGTWAQATCINDWNGDNFDHSNLGFISGGMIATYPELKPISFVSHATPPSLKGWGTPWKEWLVDNARSVASAGAQFDALAYEDNFLDLDPKTRDPVGVPVIRITHRLHENELSGYDFILDKLATWFREAGAQDVWWSDQRRIEARHCYGGTRMGHDPETSVVDEWCFSHEVPNLGLLGASTFPTAGGVNPTLTAQAVALRTCTHLMADWDRHARTI